MKPKLAIYGDSWTVPSSSNLEYKDDCWTNSRILQENYDVNVLGTSGMDFYTTYELFKKTHSKYDKIVFVVTEATRQSFTYNNMFFTSFNANFDDSHIEEKILPVIKKIEDWPMVKHILKSISTYLIYVAKDEFLEAGVSKLVDEILKIKNNAVIVPAFQNRFISDFYLCQIDVMERECMGVTEDEFRNWHELRHAHMTKENNSIFANYIYRRLQGDQIQLSLDMFVRPDPSQKLKYFKPL